MNIGKGLTLTASVLAGLLAGGMHASADVTLGNGITYHTTDPGDVAGAVETDDGLLTFEAYFDAANENNATIATDTLAFLNSLGATGAVYLGRQDGSGDLAGTSTTTASSDGGLSGTWTFNPGSTGDVGTFVVIHAGGGKTNYLYAINTPGTSGKWDTSEESVGNGRQGALSNFDLFGGSGSNACLLNCGGITGSIPEPSSIAPFGIGLIGLAGFAAIRRRTIR